MKKLTTTLALIAILLLSFTSCDKYHCDRYTGTWDFVTVRNFYKYDSNKYELLESDTIYYTGKIMLGSEDGQIIIKYTENDEITALFDSESKKTFWTNAPPCGKCPSGSFEEKDKVSLNLVFSEQERIKNDRIEGTKKKGGKNE
jgi:hypothetical protein